MIVSTFVSNSNLLCCEGQYFYNQSCDASIITNDRRQSVMNEVNGGDLSKQSNVPHPLVYLGGGAIVSAYVHGSNPFREDWMQHTKDHAARTTLTSMSYLSNPIS